LCNVLFLLTLEVYANRNYDQHILVNN